MQQRQLQGIPAWMLLDTVNSITVRIETRSKVGRFENIAIWAEKLMKG